MPLEALSYCSLILRLKGNGCGSAAEIRNYIHNAYGDSWKDIGQKVLTYVSRTHPQFIPLTLEYFPKSLGQVLPDKME